MRIRRRKNKGGSVAWQLDCGVIDCKRIQLSFKTEDEAKAERDLRKGLLKRHGESAFSVTEAERIRFAAARDQLAQVGATIEEAVAHFLKTKPNLKGALPLGKLFEKFALEKELLGIRPRALEHLRVACNSFLAGRAEQLADTVTREEVKGWILGNGWAPKTQRGYLGAVSSLFSWAQKERYVAANPCTDIPLAAMEEAEVAIFSAAQCERLLLTAACYRGPMWDRRARKSVDGFRYLPLLGYATIATFGGIRPEELRKTLRSAVDLAHGTVLVTGGKSKTRQRRVVELPPCALGWLEIWNDACPGDWIIPTNYQQLWIDLRKEAKLSPWPHDVLRHTCASMHYMLHQDEAKLKALLGHSANEDTLFRHYRGVQLPSGRAISRAEAEKFYAIVRPGLILQH